MADIIAAATGIGLAFKYLTDALKNATDIAASKGGGRPVSLFDRSSSRRHPT